MSPVIKYIIAMKPVIQKKQILKSSDYKSQKQVFVLNPDGSLSTIKDHREAVKSK